MASEQPTPTTTKFKIEQELRQMNDDWVKALIRADRDTLDRIMADDFIFAYPMEGDDKAQFIGDVVSGDVRVDHLTRDNTSVRIWGNTAILTGKDSATWSYKGRDFSGHYKVIHIYAQRDDRWQLVSVQACPIS
jgi:ketosteroid isomerase-like protein